jgi:hypothetical protein
MKFGVFMRAYAPFQAFGGGLHGDGRQASTSTSAAGLTLDAQVRFL